MKDNEIMENLEKALEFAIVKKAESFIRYPSPNTDITELCKEAYKMIDLAKVKNQIADMLQNIMAEKIVASMTTEFGADVKRMMSNVVIRKDLQDWLQIQTADLLKRIKNTED